MDVSLSLKHVLYKSHVITRGHWLRYTIGWLHRGGQSGWRRVDLSSGWISGEAAIFYVTRDVITGLWQIPDGPASPASQCSARAAGTADHKHLHYHCDTRGLHGAAQRTVFLQGWTSLCCDFHKGLIKGSVQPNHRNNSLIYLSWFPATRVPKYSPLTSDPDLYWLKTIIRWFGIQTTYIIQ